MYGLQEALESSISRFLSESGKEHKRDQTLAGLNEMVSEVSDETAENVLETIKKNAFSGHLESEREEIRQFEKRLKEHWAEPLDLLELFIRLALEAGDDFNKEYGEDAVVSNDAVFEALTRLHARACQVSSAILVLMKAGYADDADARWRTLHEIAVVSNFVSQHGQGLAERYLLHEVIQQFKLAREHQTFHSRINEEPISHEEFGELEALQKELVSQFGKQFKEDYGWAAEELGVDRPTFRMIEEQVNLDHLRPYYRMASDNVHANSHGAYFKLGLHLIEEKVLLAGPSNAGLADPGHSTAISLNLVTLDLLNTRLSFDALVAMKMFTVFVDEIGESFLKAHHEYEAITLAKRNEHGPKN